MVEEIAFISVVEGKEVAFETAVSTASRDIFPQAKGFVSLSLARGIEKSQTYALQIIWETVEDHTEGFVKSDLFTQWRGLITGILDGTPTVEHWRPVDLT
mgnify:CR=1 FL=1